ncbi:hypothetical protein A3I18_01320 [Candidatus Campbellbacteria bacterium RIFCSPLOWO2_02_FULL_35_11]|uniref:Probable pectate lyase C n=1 Tax=Candidatus Campbellbacteria bacterium RIFCSPLOWO2_02_FULL_35_11 TaxID=1797581 RepID=A0A1F5ETZ0_9BACT|nr:MAG: hypothetical protein A3I18_01320 [Candidatus Campbellbacteria bacterium RIFCSPLOWO2_02_FULL_35_11]
MISPKLIFLIAVGIFGYALSISAATYYISPTGSDTAGTGSLDNPWKTTTKIFTMGGGNTYIFRDGLYDYNGGNIINPPSGTAEQYTIIQAENDGKAIIDGQKSRNTISISGNSSYQPQYIRIIGFHAKNSSNSAIGVSGYSDSSRANHIEIKRVSGKDSGDASGSVAGFGLYTEDNLMEDSWFWGKARAMVTNYGHYPEPPPHTYRNTFRRVVARFDDTEATTQGQYVFTNYGADDSIYENCISLDHNNANDPYGAFRNRAGASNNKFLGCMAINVGNFYPFDIGDSTINITDCVAINSSQQNYVRRQSPSIVNFNRCTFVGSIGSVFSGYGTLTVNNSLFKDSGSAVCASNCHWDNSGSTSGTNSSSGDSGLLYLPRIENGSAVDGTGENGVDRGANIVKRYVDGVLTSDNLWPWPNEERIKTEMCFETNRGFCADGNGLYGGPITLTSYIWEYLGNPCPADICNYTQTFSPADTNQNGKVEMKEFVSFVGSWKSGQAALSDVLTALDRWLRGE